MPDLKIEAETYVLLKLTDLERIQKLSDCKERFYLDVFGPDAAAIVKAVVPDRAKITELPSNGRIRVELLDHPYKLNYQAIVENGLSHMQSSGRIAAFEIGSFHWVGFNFTGFEWSGIVNAADPNSKAPATMLHFEKPNTLSVKAGKKGITELSLGKAPAKRGAKGRYTKSSAPASAK